MLCVILRAQRSGVSIVDLYYSTINVIKDTMEGGDQNSSAASNTGNLTRNTQGRWWNQSTASFTSPTDPQQQQSMGSSIALATPSPVPIATSTPRLVATPPQPILVPYTRSEKQAEDELFQRIERLIRDFLNRPNRRYPYHRILEWTLDEEPTLSYSADITINPPSMVID